ncbi:UNVERIFIED_CONTAM: hypothetical protein K2H54_007043 [Gekko kuhli]
MPESEAILAPGQQPLENSKGKQAFSKVSGSASHLLLPAHMFSSSGLGCPEDSVTCRSWYCSSNIWCSPIWYSRNCLSGTLCSCFAPGLLGCSFYIPVTLSSQTTNEVYPPPYFNPHRKTSFCAFKKCIKAASLEVLLF